MNRFITEPGARARSRGVTLLELMAVVVIIGVLGTLAVNSYRGYLLRTNRTEARMALLQIQANQEKFFLQNNRYADTAELYASGRRTIHLVSASSATTPGGHYTITLRCPRHDIHGHCDSNRGQTKDAAACLVLRSRESGARTRLVTIAGADNQRVCIKQRRPTRALSHRFDLVSSALGSRRKLLQTLSF